MDPSQQLFVCLQSKAKQNKLILVLIAPLPVAPKIVPFAATALLQRGERVTITCTMAKGDTPLSILWLKDGVPLGQGRVDDDAKIKVLTFDHFNSMLTIEALELRHVGNYTCQAANPAGMTTHSQSIFVNGKKNQSNKQTNYIFLLSLPLIT